MLCQINSLIRATLKENAPMDLLSPALYRMVKKLGLVRINPEAVDLRLTILK